MKTRIALLVVTVLAMLGASMVLGALFWAVTPDHGLAYWQACALAGAAIMLISDRR